MTCFSGFASTALTLEAFKKYLPEALGQALGVGATSVLVDTVLSWRNSVPGGVAACKRIAEASIYWKADQRPGARGKSCAESQGGISGAWILGARLGKTSNEDCLVHMLNLARYFL